MNARLSRRKYKKGEGLRRGVFSTERKRKELVFIHWSFAECENVCMCGFQQVIDDAFIYYIKRLREERERSWIVKQHLGSQTEPTGQCLTTSGHERASRWPLLWITKHSPSRSFIGYVYGVIRFRLRAKMNPLSDPSGHLLHRKYL